MMVTKRSYCATFDVICESQISKHIVLIIIKIMGIAFFKISTMSLSIRKFYLRIFSYITLVCIFNIVSVCWTAIGGFTYIWHADFRYAIHFFYHVRKRRYFSFIFVYFVITLHRSSIIQFTKHEVKTALKLVMLFRLHQIRLH